MSEIVDRIWLLSPLLLPFFFLFIALSKQCISAPPLSLLPKVVFASGSELYFPGMLFAVTTSVLESWVAPPLLPLVRFCCQPAVTAPFSLAISSSWQSRSCSLPISAVYSVLWAIPPADWQLWGNVVRRGCALQTWVCDKRFTLFRHLRAIHFSKYLKR